MSRAVQELQERKNHKDGLTGVPSGFTKLDRILSGWQKSDLIIIAARPGMGKTAFVVSALRNASVFDVAPTILYLMGLPVARDMEGRVATEVLEDGFARAHPVTFIPSYESLAVTPMSAPADPALPPLPEEGP